MASTIPMSLRLDADLESLLSEGSRRTHHNKRTLIRLTLRRYLPEVIEREAQPEPAPRLTSVAPWPRGALLKAYRRVERSSDKVEAAATAAQRAPSMDD